MKINLLNHNSTEIAIAQLPKTSDLRRHTPLSCNSIFSALCTCFAAPGRKTTDSTSKILERSQIINKEIASDSFKIQKIYFDCANSSHGSDKITCSRQIGKTLDNSIPDAQLVDLEKDLMAFLTAHEKDLSTIEKDKINKTLFKLSDAKSTALLIAAIISSPSEREKKRLQIELKGLVLHRLKSLASDESLIIPCGYMNGNIYDLPSVAKGRVGGHALILKVKKTKETFEATLYNTGEGLFHHQHSTNGKFYPLFYQNIPSQQILDDAFCDGLTKFSFNTDGIYHSNDIYKLFEKYLGQPRLVDEAKDKPYRIQGAVGSCTKKSLQVWFHDEWKDYSSLYHRFRCFRLSNTIQIVESIQSKLKAPFVYQHPLARWGFTSSVNLAVGIIQGIRGLLFGSRVQFLVPKDEIGELLARAKAVFGKKSTLHNFTPPLTQANSVSQGTRSTEG